MERSTSAPTWANIGVYGQSPAILFDEGNIVTYADLEALTERLREQLDPKWRLVALEMAASCFSVAALLACLRAGIAVILLPDQAKQELVGARRRFSPDAVFRKRGERWLFQEEASSSCAPIHPDLGIVLMTSGSTGEGKAVRISRQALTANARQIAIGLRLETDDRALLTLPLHYAYGLSVLSSHLAVGASIYLPKRSVLEDGFIRAAIEVSPTNLPGVPFTYELFERKELVDCLPESLRFATVAGGRLEAERAAAWPHEWATEAAASS